MKKKLLVYSLIILILLFAGCQADERALKSNDDQLKLNLIVSKNFGQQVIYDEVLEFKEDMNVMELLEENLTIEKAYGGSFVNSINGIKSGFTGVKDKKKIDWFYYVNGVLAQVGAEDYYLKPNDVVVWDYHDWSENAYVSNVIGSYPYNFMNGHGDEVLGIDILTTQDFEQQANKLADYLNSKTGREVNFKVYDKDIENEISKDGTNTIVIGDYKQILGIEYIDNIYQRGEKSGIFFKIDNRSVVALNNKNEIQKEYEKGAVITSILKNYGSAASIWIITGNDEKCIENAIETLYKESEKIRGMFSTIISEKEIINIPTEN
ncbi:DUF4430 domain-containing protein [Brassicibacter mesophilus]|uniref:DUF4430 domain-containing protein n=1 Tax=Brassicibacter mesophilus TaxID=745119 RepID=UPI003D19E9D1